MINKTAAECEFERLLLTANEEYQTLKNEEKDVVIRGKSLARIYRQLIDVIGQLKTERKCSAVLREGLTHYKNIDVYSPFNNSKATQALAKEAEIRG